jgi:hypothetical protein
MDAPYPEMETTPSFEGAVLVGASTLDPQGIRFLAVEFDVQTSLFGFLRDLGRGNQVD